MARSQQAPFGVLLKQHRDAAGLTQEELAERARLSARAISNLERGVRHRPYSTTVRQLAEALELSDAGRAAFEAAARPAGYGAETDQAGTWVPGHQPMTGQTFPRGGFLGLWPEGALVARDEEMRTIRAAIDVVLEEEGRLVLLTGEPGIGKTRLAQEVLLIADQMGFLSGSGVCYESRQTVPYYPFLDALTTLYRAAPAEIRSQIPSRWPLLTYLFPGEEVPALASPPGVLDEQERLFRAVSGFVQTLTETAPVAILLDDLHWSDSASIDLLQHLARHLRGHPVLLLGTYRHVEVRQRQALGNALRDLRREHLVEEVRIDGLRQSGTAALMAATAGDERISTELAELVHRHTEGNPFFIEQVLRMLMERGDIYREDGRWRLREVQRLDIPEGVRSAIGERVSRIGETPHAVLQQASVLGPTFAFDELQALGGRAEEELETALEEAIQAGLVRVVEREDYAFNHALTQQTLYEELSPRRRRKLHLAAGEILERLPGSVRRERAAELARHFVEGDEPARAFTYSLLAGDLAEDVFAHAEAERHFQMARRLVRDDRNTPGEAALLERLGRVFLFTSRYDDALDVLERAVGIYRKANDLEAVARATAQIGRVHADRGTSAEGLAYLEPMLHVVEGGGPSSGAAALYTALAFLCFAGGKYHEQLAAADRASEIARQIGDDAILVNAEVRRALALLVLGEGEKALSVLRDAIPLAERVDDLVSLHRAFSIAADIHRVGGQFDEAKMWRERGLATATRLGDPAIVAFALATLGRVCFFQGDWTEAGVRLEQALTTASSIEPSWFAAYPALHLGELRLAQGAHEEASRLLEVSITIARRNGDMQALPMAHQALAERDLLDGRPEAARARLQPFLDRPGLTELRTTELLPVLARAELECGNQERAGQIVADALSRAMDHNARLAAMDALRTRGVLLSEQQRWVDADHDFLDALSMARAMPYPHAEARILYESGLMYSRQGEMQRAREELREALRISRRLGARPYIERTERALGSRMVVTTWRRR